MECGKFVGLLVGVFVVGIVLFDGMVCGECWVEGVVHQSLGFSFWWDIFVVSYIIVLER